MSAIETQAAPVRKSGAGISQALRLLSCETASGVPLPGHAALEVRPIQNSQELEIVYRMTHDAYVEMGFIQPQADGRLVHYPHLDALAETTILVALLDGRIVGTNSLTLDGPAGLHVDEDFKAETDALRATGRRLASSFRINTLKEFRQRHDIVMSLIKFTTQHLIAAGVETCLFIFHKRHERIYRRLLNMRTVAELPEIRCVSNFPAVYMRCDFEMLPAWCLEASSRNATAAP